MLFPGLLLGLRFAIAYARDGGFHLQSLILSSILTLSAMVCYMLGVLADIVAINRRLSEDIRARLLLAEIRDASE